MSFFVTFISKAISPVWEDNGLMLESCNSLSYPNKFVALNSYPSEYKTLALTSSLNPKLGRKLSACFPLFSTVTYEMKRKIVTLLLMCALSVNFSACGNNNTDSSAKSETSDNQNEDATNADESSEPENPESEESQEDADNAKPEGEDAAPEEEPKPEESPETIYNIGDSALLKDWNINVTDAQTVDSISSGYIVFSPKEEGNKFLQVYVTVENKGKQADNFLPSFGLRDDVLFPQAEKFTDNAHINKSVTIFRFISLFPILLYFY